jgi:SAM-dependent methyltransferase
MNRLRRSIRHTADRIAAPYVGRLESKLDELHRQTSQHGDGYVAADAELDAADGNVPSDWFHATNHELRTIELERLQGPFDRVVSIGANGTWYFEWVRRAIGDVTEHIGVEAYMERPDDLPDYVSWVAETADSMSSVASESVDLVFAGQTTEHLWAHELTGFLLESHRVLREGGLLALDSPNRTVTQHLRWSHGEHTVELDQHEMCDLLRLAGFDVESTRGIWLCRDGDTVLELEGGQGGAVDPAQFVRRATLGADRPDDCFVWWINARRSGVAPDAEQLQERVAALFADLWPTRLSRGFFAGIDLPLRVPNGPWREISRTLPFPLHAGTWRCSIQVAEGDWESVSALEVALDAPGDHRIHTLALSDAVRTDRTLTWEFEQPYLSFALVLVVSLANHGELVIAPPIEVRLEAS